MCPNHVGLELMSKGCVRWAPSPPARPPNCCPRSARCLSDGTCHYNGVPLVSFLYHRLVSLLMDDATLWLSLVECLTFHSKFQGSKLDGSPHIHNRLRAALLLWKWRVRLPGSVHTACTSTSSKHALSTHAPTCSRQHIWWRLLQAVGLCSQW